ncbi:hypothetical protein OD91_0224 [Lutibacter sp. Hel_I_33_5]|uniref:hypothetical protein n=1 Tax=Lutibacter sp. Hel_I_33_5 TaxID=1566289 RepID=UPI00119CF08C|nr:hypothetical protein [Lutibacter sp. Hel_I_33_5]TVZ54985.1 hypothetical protein OD91_0224 [Lutibacter sp. Hel_I_33_5]
MKRILLILVLLTTTMAFSQEKIFEKEVQKISKKIDEITKEEKDSLKIKVNQINLRLENKEITQTVATQLKKTAAAYHAKNIENRVGAQEKLLQQLVQDKTNGKIASTKEDDYDDNNTFTIGNKTFRFSLNKERAEKRISDRKKKWEKKGKRGKASTSQFVFAMGVNNVLIDDDFGSLDVSNYKFWKSRFYEIGWTWKTRFNRRPSASYLKYGVSFLWNNLRAENNQYHVVNGNTTGLQVHPENLTESRLRHAQVIFPVHFEWDFSKNGSYSDGTPRNRTNKSVRFGLGAFFGFKLGTRQYIEYLDANNVRVEQVEKNDFNTKTVNYGLSTYLGYRDCSFYVKYDLNTLFNNSNTRNISLGLRLDLD